MFSDSSYNLVFPHVFITQLFLEIHLPVWILGYFLNCTERCFKLRIGDKSTKVLPCIYQIDQTELFNSRQILQKNDAAAKLTNSLIFERFGRLYRISLYLDLRCCGGDPSSPVPSSPGAASNLSETSSGFNPEFQVFSDSRPVRLRFYFTNNLKKIYIQI